MLPSAGYSFGGWNLPGCGSENTCVLSEQENWPGTNLIVIPSFNPVVSRDYYMQLKALPTGTNVCGVVAVDSGTGAARELSSFLHTVGQDASGAQIDIDPIRDGPFRVKLSYRSFYDPTSLIFGILPSGFFGWYATRRVAPYTECYMEIRNANSGFLGQTGPWSFFGSSAPYNGSIPNYAGNLAQTFVSQVHVSAVDTGGSGGGSSGGGSGGGSTAGTTSGGSSCETIFVNPYGARSCTANNLSCTTPQAWEAKVGLFSQGFVQPGGGTFNDSYNPSVSFVAAGRSVTVTGNNPSEAFTVNGIRYNGFPSVTISVAGASPVVVSSGFVQQICPQ